MLDNLLDLIRQNAGSSIINNPAIPNEHNDAAISAAGNSIMSGLQNMMSSGNIQDVVNLFNHTGGNIASTPAAQQISGGFIQNLMSQFGLNQSAASGVASSLIPQVLQNLVHQTNDPNNSSFNIQSINGQIAGGGQGGGLENIISQFTGGNQAAGGSSIMDTLKGLVGN